MSTTDATGTTRHDKGLFFMGLSCHIQCRQNVKLKWVLNVLLSIGVCENPPLAENVMLNSGYQTDVRWTCLICSYSEARRPLLTRTSSASPSLLLFPAAAEICLCIITGQGLKSALYVSKRHLSFKARDNTHVSLRRYLMPSGATWHLDCDIFVCLFWFLFRDMFISVIFILVFVNSGADIREANFPINYHPESCNSK